MRVFQKLFPCYNDKTKRKEGDHGKFIQSAIDRGETSTDIRERFAIPQAVINEGKGKIIQNPGY